MLSLNTSLSSRRLRRALHIGTCALGLVILPAALQAMATTPSAVMVEHSKDETTILQNGQTTRAKEHVKVTLFAGQKLKLHLRGNITTSYAWSIVGAVPACVAPLGEGKYTDDAHPEGMVGGGGWKDYAFTAKTPGSGTLRLIYGRSSGEPAETLTIDVTVQALPAATK